VTFFATALRASGFLAPARLATGLNFFFAGLVATFFFGATLAFAVFRVTDLLAAARFAFGRVDVDVTLFRFTAALFAVREGDVRDVERLKPLVTALMEASK